MKPGIPWSVKGIEPDVREAAKEAARRSGMTLGEWLNSTILTKADDATDTASIDQPRRAKAPSRAPVASHALERTASRLEDIAEHLSRLSQRESFAAPAHFEAPPRQQDTEMFSRILNRVDSNERQTVEAFTAVNERLSVLGRQITQATKRTERPEESPGYVALEKAVRNIVEHMETSEKRNRDNFKSLQERISGMSAKAASAPQEQITRQAPAISQLENRINELARRVERTDAPNTAAALPDLLKQELTDLANRIDTVRETSEQLAAKAQTQAVQASQQELRAIETRIVGLIKDAQSSLSNNGAAPADMQRLRAEIERVNARIDDAQKAQASGGDVKALRAAVEQLSTRVAQGPDMRPLADMDRRILEITQRLEQTQAQNQAQARNLPQVTELERRLAELDNKISEAVTGQRNPAATELEQHLIDINERVGRTEQQLGSLETIERAVNQLFESLEQQKKWTQNVAETAASQMAQHIMAQTPQQVSLSGAPEILALQQGLQAVQQASENADHRNQETLEAVHETLEQIVTKLSELETAAIGQRVAAAAMPTGGMDQTMQQAPEPVASYPEPETTAFVQPQMHAQENAEVGNPLRAPTLDPFTQQPTNSFDEPSSNPFDSVIQSARASTNQAAAAAENDDFIAAARRAAQASFQPKSILSGISPGAAKLSEDSSKKLLKFSMFKGKGKAAKAEAQPAIILTSEIKPPAGFKTPANSNEKKRVHLVIAGLCLLVAASFYTFNMLGGSKPAPAVEPTKIEQPAQQQGDVQPAQPAAVPAPLENNAAPAVDTGGTAQPPQPKPAQLDNQQGALETSDPMLTAAVDPAEATDMSALGGRAAKATMTLQQAAAASNPEAFYATATRFLEGSGGVKQDYSRAAYWYGKAAAQGLAPAQYRLGTLYERGKGVARDLEAAQGWYERAAGLGNVKAMHNAAVLAASSDGHKPDYARAFKWFSLGAAHGLKDSQYNLAVLLEHGLGTPVNLSEAMFWYTEAGKQNDADAAKRAATIARTLTEADNKLIEDRINRWMPDDSPQAANATVLGQASWSTDPLPAG